MSEGDTKGSSPIEKGSRFTPPSRTPAEHREANGAHSRFSQSLLGPPPFDEAAWISGFNSSPSETQIQASKVIQEKTEQASVDNLRTPQFGMPIKESPKTSPEGFVTYTLKPGVLLRIRGLVVPENDSDQPLDIPAPEGLVVRGHSKDEGRIVRGDSPKNDTLWKYVGAIKTPDGRIRGGWRAWRRNEKGQFAIPVMHPDYKEANTTLDLK